MPSFVEARPQSTGKMGYVYDISGEDVVAIATDIIMIADAPFVFQGKVGDQKHALQQPSFVATPLQQGGVVAGSVPYNGSSVNVYFASLKELLVVPSDGLRSTADTLVGASDDYMLPDGTYADEEGNYDPFDDEFSDAEYAAGPMGGSNVYGDIDDGMGDPRGSELMDRYGDSYDPAYDSPAPAGNGGGEEVIGKGQWLLTLLLLAIPVVNLVALIIWLVSKKTPQTKKNFLIIQVVMWIASLLATLGVAVALVASGAYFALVGQLMGPSVDSEYSYEIYDPDTLYGEGGYDADFEDDAGDDADLDAEEAEESESLDDGISGGSVTDSAPTSAAVDNIARYVTQDGRVVAVITMSATNGTSEPAAPSALFDITGKQGQNNLEPNFAELPTFAPATFDAAIAPGASETFQVCYYLVDDQDIVVTVADKATGKTLVHVTQSI